MKYHKKRQRKPSGDSPKATSRQHDHLSGSEVIEEREDEGQHAFSPNKHQRGHRDEQAADSEPRGGALNTKLTEYLNEIWKRRAELNNPKKVFIPWRSPENLDYVSVKKKKPLVLLDENNRQANKSGKEIMQRSLDLALQSCTLLAKRNALAVDSRDEDSKADQQGRGSREASGNKGNSRVERSRRVAAKQSAELNRSMTIKGSRSTKRPRVQGVGPTGRKRAQQIGLEEIEVITSKASGSRTGRINNFDSEDHDRDKHTSMISDRSGTDQEDKSPKDSTSRHEHGSSATRRFVNKSTAARVRKGGKPAAGSKGRRTGIKGGQKHKQHNLKRGRASRVAALKKGARGRPKAK